MRKSLEKLLFQLVIAFVISVVTFWQIHISWQTTLTVLSVLITINWAIQLPGDRCADLMNSFRDMARLGVTLAVFAVLRILFWSAFRFSMIESFSTGQGVGPRGAMNLATSAPVRETIIWELLLDGALLALGFWLATQTIKKQTGENNASA